MDRVTGYMYGRLFLFGLCSALLLIFQGSRRVFHGCWKGIYLNQPRLNTLLKPDQYPGSTNYIPVTPCSCFVAPEFDDWNKGGSSVVLLYASDMPATWYHDNCASLSLFFRKYTARMLYACWTQRPATLNFPAICHFLLEYACFRFTLLRCWNSRLNFFLLKIRVLSRAYKWIADIVWG